MPQTLSNYDAALKEFYEGAIRETLNNKVVAFKKLDEGDREWSGRHVRFPIHTRRSPGVGARAENTNLPDASNQTYNEVRITAAYNYGRIELTGQVLAGGKNAFAEAMDAEMNAMVNDLTIDLGRQTWGDASGRLAQVGAAGASSSQISVFNRFAEPGQPGARYIGEGAILDGGTVADPDAMFASAVVQSISISENPATTTDTITVDRSDVSVSQCETFLFNQDVTGQGVEMIGLRGLIDQFSESNIYGSNAYAGSAVQNVNRASVSRWNANVLGNSGVARTLTPFLIQKAVDKVATESGMEPDFMWGHHSVITALLEHAGHDRRYVQSGPLNPDTGFGKAAFDGIELIRDWQAPYNELYGGKKSALKIYTLLDFEWADDDGAILSRVSNRDSFEAFVRCYKQLALDESPKSLFVIRDIKTDL